MKVLNDWKSIQKAKSIVGPQFEERDEPGGDENFPWYPTPKSQLEVVGYLPETTEALMRNSKNGTFFAVFGNVVRQVNKNDLELSK